PPQVLGSFKEAKKLMAGVVEKKGEFHQVWPAMVTPDLQSGPGAARPDGTLRNYTSACGQTFFRGDRLGPEIKGSYFLCEPVGRLIRRAEVTVRESGRMELLNPYEKTLGEFLTSTDGNFRPVNCYTGPDGCLYVIDMYHGIIQEQAFMTSYLRGEILKAGYEKNIQRGRIYRIVERGRKPGPRPRLLAADPDELVQALTHPNGWWRDMAQSLLVSRRVTEAGPALKTLALRHPEATTRLHALWTLHGLGALDDETVAALGKDPHPQIRVSLAAALVPTRHQKDLVRLIGDHHPLVAARAVTALGKTGDPTHRRLIARCLEHHPDNPTVLQATQWLSLQASQKMETAERPSHLSEAEQKLFVRGEQIYRELCTTCHGSDGQGLPGPEGKDWLAPSLVGSPRVINDEEAAILVLLHGMTGPIDGRRFDGIMAPFGATNSDDWVAAVLTFCRNQWGHSGSAISPSSVRHLREGFPSRTVPWTQAELEQRQTTDDR
ncbi:MAG: HEAT repeat domain-containing protein, partial [Verrucomicrobiota bacterium]